MDKFRRKISLFLCAVLMLGAVFTPAIAQEESIVALFSSPDNDAKAMLRYWLPDAAVTYDMLEENLTDLYEAGFGGVEVALFSSQVAYNNSEYGFGTENWRETMKNILKIAAGFENGFRVDFTLSPCWPVAVNNLDPNDVSADQQLVYAWKKLDAASGIVDLPMPATDTHDLGGNAFITQDRLVGAVIGQVASVNADGTPVLAPESLRVLQTELSGHTTVAGIPSVEGLAENSPEYQYVLELYSGEAEDTMTFFEDKLANVEGEKNSAEDMVIENTALPDTSVFFEDSAGNPISLRTALADTQDYWTVDLAQAELGEYAPSEGDTLAAGDYVLYGFYNRGTGGTTSDYSSFWFVIGSIFQDALPGVAYWISLFEEAGVDALIAYLDENIFCDEELVALLQDAADTVGGAFFEDSLENRYPDGIAWAESYASFFAEQNGYDLTAFLPFVTGAAESAGGDGARYWEDYNTTISRMYQQNHIAPLQEYLHEKVGYNYRA